VLKCAAETARLRSVPFGLTDNLHEVDSVVVDGLRHSSPVN
jgi:hypothetical protein